VRHTDVAVGQAFGQSVSVTKRLLLLLQGTSQHSGVAGRLDAWPVAACVLGQPKAFVAIGFGTFVG
jgi:hypothetical protein